MNSRGSSTVGWGVAALGLDGGGRNPAVGDRIGRRDPGIFLNWVFLAVAK